MPPRRRDTQAIPILAAANILAPVPLVELHLRNDRTPSLPPHTDKHTTHPTWYVLPFILCSKAKSALDAERRVKAAAELRLFWPLSLNSGCLASDPDPPAERGCCVPLAVWCSVRAIGCSLFLPSPPPIFDV